ncbi:E3 ubiquitin-protein ligase RING1-like [Melia azedarach]|uniref:E3 ubiquitin-protein ligase RING1-like n=1 Tax=Melia azedarach TaxID=155640 RepID=A0ACC1X1U7_MELAZ|nr:E3 ubiquitin-protein ligase RING1-like [Melia azedarach]
MASGGSSYWCYRCNRVTRVRARNQDSAMCPGCGTGFIEQLDAHSRSALQRFPPAEMYFDSSQNLESLTIPRLRRTRRNGGDRSPFNPVIVLRGSQNADSGAGNDGTAAERGNFELYYDDGTGSGLRPLPASMSEFLMSSGFDRVLDQLSHLDFNGVTRFVNPPAPKKAIESMPKVKILPCHLAKDTHCAVCREPFELNSEAREMPCKHIYHAQCIFPWLSMRNSCPLCRRELPTEENGGTGDSEETVGLTIWRLPGGGFAVGRFYGGRRAAESEFPSIFTEMDGGFNAAGGAPRRISWVPGGRRARESRGLARAFRGFTSLLGRIRISSRSNPEFERRSPFMDVIYGRSGAAANYFNQFNLGENRFAI